MLKRFPRLLNFLAHFHIPSDIFWSRDKSWASFCCLSANSPRPLKSTRNNAMMESTICKQGYKTITFIFGLQQTCQHSVLIHWTIQAPPPPPLSVWLLDSAGLSWDKLICNDYLGSEHLKPFGHTSSAFWFCIVYCTGLCWQTNREDVYMIK